jgi:hypothetical protein
MSLVSLDSVGEIAESGKSPLLPSTTEFRIPFLMVGKAPSPHSRINGAKSTGNPNPTYSHLHNQPGQTNGHAVHAKLRPLETYTEYQGFLDMTSNPDLDFLAEVRDNPNLRYDLRATAASARLPYVVRRLASEPYIPPVPEAYDLPPLTSTKLCQEALAIVTADMVSGKLRLDTGKYFLANIQTAMESLKISEVEAQIAEFRSIVEQVEAAKNDRSLNGQVIEHIPHPDP